MAAHSNAVKQNNLGLCPKTRRSKGFTLAELLIVVAIIAVLVAISIPIFSRQLERSRDATTVANIRSAYSLAQSEYLSTRITDSRTDGAVHSYPVKDSSGNIIMTVNFKNGSIYQICVMKVQLKSQKNNQYSGLADDLPFHDVLTEDKGVPGVSPYVIFQYKTDGSLEQVKVITPSK